ncbi:MAG: translation initiation factor IF-2 subunit gamma [Candidatus Woesearchaeota archaeon]
MQKKNITPTEAEISNNIEELEKTNSQKNSKEKKQKNKEQKIKKKIEKEVKTEHKEKKQRKKKEKDTEVLEKKTQEEVTKIQKREEISKEELHEKRVEEAKKQPEFNIGLVGHVDHGKTTITEKLSGKWTDTHSEEIKRGITIRLGYADVTFRKCPLCQGVEGYTKEEFCPIHNVRTEVLRKVSFVDAPGHESLMATMLSGAAIMDYALMIIAANEPCPQPQTREHLTALQIIGIKDIIVVQNKIDLVTKEEALKNYKEIKNFLRGTVYENAPIIPVSAHQNINIDLLIKTIVEYFKVPERNKNADPLMFVARSFDINKPGTEPSQLQGGVLGGALKQGVLRIGDEIEIKPGRKVESYGKIVWQPLITKIVGLKTGGYDVQEVGPGGSVGVLTTLDPSIVKADSLAGNVVGLPGKTPPIREFLRLKLHLLERVVGAQDELLVEPIKQGETLMININSTATVGTVIKLSPEEITCKLIIPVCAYSNSRATISRRIGDRYRLIGYGEILEIQEQK